MFWHSDDRFAILLSTKYYCAKPADGTLAREKDVDFVVTEQVVKQTLPTSVRPHSLQSEL